MSVNEIDGTPRAEASTMLLSTMNDLPGYEITEVLGEVFGLTVRSRNLGSQIGAGIKSMFGGELKGMTKALYESRNETMSRMIEEATRRGGNAIVAPAASSSSTRPKTSMCMRFLTTLPSGTGTTHIIGPLPVGSTMSAGQSSGRGRPSARPLRS